MRNPKALVITLLLLTAGSFSIPMRADLLDPDMEPSAPPAPPPSPTPKEPLHPGKAKQPPAETPKKAPKTTPKNTPTADRKNAKSTETDVLPPKNPGKKTSRNSEKEPVHFQSRGLKGLREEGVVELLEDVVVTQGDFRLEANHAQVYFDEGANDVQRVVADGNVKITNIDENTGERLKAYGDRVEFENKERTVVLEGNARLWRGKDSMIRGKKITYEMDTGWIRADRVAGEVTPSERGKK